MRVSELNDLKNLLTRAMDEGHISNKFGSVPDLAREHIKDAISRQESKERGGH